MDPAAGDYQFRALTEGGPVQRRWHANKIALALDMLGPERSDRILDAGCGSGIVSEGMRGCGPFVAAVDINVLAVRFARDSATRSGGGFAVARLERLPFKEESLDKACCLEVLEHLQREETEGAVAELYRVLKPGGMLLVTTPNYGGFWPIIEWVVNCVKSVSFTPCDEHVSRMNAASLSLLARRHGFTIERTGSFNHISPLAAAFSGRLAGRLFAWEVRCGGAWGNLLFCLCRKPGARDRGAPAHE